MPLEARLLIGLAIALAVVYLDDARWRSGSPSGFEFYDRPVGYKGHAAPTPYLGGAAVVAGFLVAMLLLGGSWDRTPAAARPASWSCGSSGRSTTAAPSRRSSASRSRSRSAPACGRSASAGTSGRARSSTSRSRAFWVVAVVNAFNLFDNMDGAATSMAAVVAARARAARRRRGRTRGWRSPRRRCAAPASGFLPHNLFASPARIFLGDGGSMPIGFAVAALAMIGVSEAAPAWQSLAMGLLFVGIPALDTTLVMVSRRRRGLSILTGGRDHLTHRAQQRLRTARAVAVALGGAQAVISALAVVALRGGSAAIVVAVIAYLVGARRGDRAARHALRAATPAPGAPRRPPPPRRPARRDLRRARSCCSAARGRARRSARSSSATTTPAIWVPAGLALLGVATAGLIARPPPLGLPAGAAARRARRPRRRGRSSPRVGRLDRAGRRGGQPLARSTRRSALVLLVLVRSERIALALLGALAVGVRRRRRRSCSCACSGSDPATCSSAGGWTRRWATSTARRASSCSALWLCLAAAERRQAARRGASARPARRCSAACCCSRSRAASRSPRPCRALVVLALVPGRVAARLGAASSSAARSRSRAGAARRLRRGAAAALPAEVGHRAARHLAARGRRWRASLWGAASGSPAARSAARGRAASPAAGSSLGVLVAGASSASPRRAASRTRSTASTPRSSGSTVEPQGTAVDGRRRASCPAPATATTTGASPGARGGTRRSRGVGAGNYDRPYFAQRATTEDIRQPHSIELQLLSELGLVGAALLALALAGIALGRGAHRAAARTLAERAHGASSRRSAMVVGLARAHERGLDPPAPGRHRRSRSSAAVCLVRRRRTRPERRPRGAARCRVAAGASASRSPWRSPR